MILDFTNEQLYLTAYGMTVQQARRYRSWPEIMRWATLNDIPDLYTLLDGQPVDNNESGAPPHHVLTYNPGPKTIPVGTPMMFGPSEETYPEPERTVSIGPKFEEHYIDARLDSMLEEAGIEFSSPNHMVHYLNYGTLLVLVGCYMEEYYNEPIYRFDGTLITDLTEDQLRKLVLWLYHMLGGTECE